MAEFNDIENKQVNEVETEKDFSPVYSYTQKVNSLISAGKITAPKYRTLSQEQMASYLKAKDMPEYDKKVAMSALKKADENTSYENASNAAVIEAMDILSGDRTRLAIGNMLVSGDYTPLIETGATLAGYKAGEEAAKAAGRGWLAQTGAGIVGATAAGAIVGALTPTATASQEEESAILEKYMTPEQKAEREKQGKEFYEQTAVAQLKKAGYTDEQIEKLRKESAVQSFGRAIMQSAMADIEYKAAIAPKVDEGSIAATIVGGAASFGELALVGAGTKMAASKIAKSVKMPTDRFGRKAAEFTRKKGTSYDEVVDRYAGMVGTKAGTAATTTEMTSEIMGQGALESVRKYIEQTGDTKLEHYQGDLKNVALDAYNTHIQNIIEYKLGVGKFIRNPRLATKYGEWLNGFAQEFSQGEINDIAEWLKGNKSAMDILRNIPQNIVEGVVGAVLQGGVGTGIYTYYHNQNVNDLTGVIMGQSTAENPISEQKAREFAERKVVELEEGIANDVAQDVIQFTGATQYQGKIYDTIRDNIKKAVDYQREQMKETLEGSKYDDMTEDELAQHIESVAQDETDRTVIESLESGTPLSESPRLKGETIDGTYYLEGSDYAKETAEKAQQERARIREAVYARKIAEKEAKQAAKEAVKVELQKAKEEAKQAQKVKSDTVAAIKGGNVDIIGNILSKAGFRTRDLSGTQIKELAKMNWELLQDQNLGVAQSRGTTQIPLSAIEQNVESGNAVLLRAGYTQEQIDKMDDETWNRAVLTQYRKESPEPAQPEYTEEDIASWEGVEFQEQFDLADENARLDDIYPAYEGETIEVDGKERTVYNSNGERIAKSKEALTNFWRWFGDSKVVDIQGRPLVVYHQTSETFNTFERGRDKAGKYDYGTPGGFFFKSSDRNIGIAGNIQMPVYLRAENGIYFTDRETLQKYWARKVDGYADLLKQYQNVDKDYETKLDKIESDMDKAIDDLESSEKYKNATDEEQYEMRVALTDSFDTKDFFAEWHNAGNKLAEQMKSLVNDYVSRENIDLVKLENDSGGIGKKTTDAFIVFEPTQIKSVDNRGTFSADTGNIYFQETTSTRYRAIDPRFVIPKVRGGWTKDKILRYLKNYMSHAGAGIAAREIANFDTFEDFMNHVFYHGARYGTSGRMQPSITMSDREVERIGGGGYGEKYWAISITKSKKVAGNFATSMGGGNIYPILLAKNAKVIEMPELTDSVDLEDHIVDLYEKGIDAVWIGDKNAGEQELAVINPRALINIGSSEYYGAYKLGSEENPIRLNTEEDFRKIYEFAKNYKNMDENTRLDEARRIVHWQTQQRGKGGAYDARNRSITLGSGANITTLPHELAHYWIDKNFKWARSGKASTAWMQQWQAVEKWLGIDPEDKYLTSEASEKFARAYERFLGEEELPLVLKKSMADFRDFVLDHYDYELDDAKGLQDRLGRPIKLDDAVKEWFRKSIYDSYMSASDMEVVNERLAQTDREIKELQPAIDQSKELETAAQNSVEINEVAPTGMEIQTSADVSNDVIVGKRTIGGGEEKESKGVIRQELGGTYESTSWNIQEQMVSDYLETVSIDEAIEALDNDTYPDKIDPNFLRQALVERLLDEGREIEATALIEETADDFTEAAQKLQAARRINTPFTNAIRMLTIGKAEKLAQARYGKNKDAVKSLDSAMNALVAKYEKDFMNAQTDEERELVYATMQDEAIRTIGTLEKDKTGGLDFQDIEDKEERKEASALRKRQNKRASIKAYRSRAKRALKQALGLEPSREQVRQIKKLSVKVAREIQDFRKAVKENKTSAIDPTKILEAQNELNEYMNKQLPPRVLSTAADAVNSYMMANMLWNPATNVFNLESTWVQMIPHIMATYINYGKGTISWGIKRKLIQQALALQAKTGYNIFSLQDFFDKKTLWAEKFYEPTSMAGKAIRFPLTMLGLADTMNKGIVFLNHVDSMATSQAKEEGKKNGWNKEQITQRAKELFYQALNTDPRTITRDGLKIRQSAVREGEEATFTQNSQTAQFVNKFRKMLNFGAKTGLGNVIMPFTTTIANIAEDTVLNYALGSVRNIPLNLIPALTTQFDKTATAEMKKEAWKKLTPETKNVIKNMIGILMVLSLALSDPDDDSYVLGYDRQTEVDKDIRQNHNAPSGYAVRIGNKWVDLDLFGIGSPWARAYLIAKRNDFSTNGWVKGVASVIDLVPGVSEIEDIYKSLETTTKYKGESEALMEFAGGKVEDIAERLIPAQALFNEIGNITDITKRVNYVGLKERVLGKIPFARETLEERTSKQTGEPIPQTDILANLITGQRIKDYVESTPADRARYELAKAGEALNYQEGRSKLSALGKESKEYKKAVQRVRRDFTKKLNSAVQTTEYQRLDIDQKKKFADKLHKEALDNVKASYGLQDKKSVEKKKKKK